MCLNALIVMGNRRWEKFYEQNKKYWKDNNSNMLMITKSNFDGVHKTYKWTGIKNVLKCSYSYG